MRLASVAVVALVQSCGSSSGPPATPDAPPPPDACTMLLLYPDTDGDGFGAEPGRLVCEGTAGYVVDRTDCSDADALAFPGQTDYFVAQVAGVGGWDFDCDGEETRQHLVSRAPCHTRSVDACPFPYDAWELGVPDCGAEGRWVDSCHVTANGCRPDVHETRTQACR